MERNATSRIGTEIEKVGDRKGDKRRKIKKYKENKEETDAKRKNHSISTVPDEIEKHPRVENTTKIKFDLKSPKNETKEKSKEELVRKENNEEEKGEIKQIQMDEKKESLLEVNRSDMLGELVLSSEYDTSQEYDNENDGFFFLNMF